MKIAIMMRAMDQPSGHNVIIEGLVENMLEQDKKNHYLLLYRTNKYYGRFAKYCHVKEKLITAPHKFFWDQIAVPYHAWRENADIIYNPKFSVPLISPCPVVMGLHEPAWWAWPEHYEWFDRKYMKFMLPIYIKKSKHLFPISQFVIDENEKYLNISLGNATINYPAPKPYFRKIDDQALLAQSRVKYQLPERFILSVTRVDHPGLDKSDSFFPGKNVETTVRAYIKIRDKVPHQLVIAGRRVRDFLLHIGLQESDFTGIHFMDFIPHEELPALLNLAELFVLPSFYESYAMALVEAMACGCPVVASKTGACPEITAGAAQLADPYSYDDFAGKMLHVLNNESLQAEMRTKSLLRAKFFDYTHSAKIVIEKMEQVIKNIQ